MPTFEPGSGVPVKGCPHDRLGTEKIPSPLPGDACEALLWKLDGLSEYDVRRPMTPTGTNMLGLVKHVASVELGYFGATFGRPSEEPLPWYADDAEPNADMWATAAETREQIISLYHRAWAHSDATIEMVGLDAIGHVPHWPDDRSEVTLHQNLRCHSLLRGAAASAGQPRGRGGCGGPPGLASPCSRSSGPCDLPRSDP
jgi:Protein of unknown function (DUF664)